MSDRHKNGPAYPGRCMRPRIAGSILIPLLLIGALLIAAGPADAHAYLLRAEPEQNTRVDDPPTTFTFWFSEALEPRHVRIEVIDSDGVDHVESIQVDPESRTRVEVEVEPLETGLYTVTWFVVSSVDGHDTNGAFLLAVGMDIPEGAELPGATEVTDVRFWETIARAVAYAGASLVAGIPVYLLFRFRVVPVKGWMDAPLGDRVTREALLMKIAAWGALASAIAVSTLIIGLGVRIGVGPVEAMTSTINGQLLGVRTTLLLAAAALAFMAARSSRRLPWIVATLGVALAALLVTSLGAHAASTSAGLHGLNITMDAIHQLAAAAWISGIIALLVTLPGAQDTRTAGVLVRDFSPFAVGAVVVLVATGVYGSLLHLEGPLGPPMTGWEWALVIKVLLLAPLLALGAYNRYVLQPRLLKGDEKANVPRIKRSVRAEVLLMVFVLLATGAITHATPPAQIDVPTGPLPGQVHEFESEGTGHLYRVTVQPQPVTVGIQNITVHLDPGEELPERVQIFFEVHGPDGGEDSYQLERIEDENRWYVRDTIFTQTGGWHFDVIVQGRGLFETFDFFVILD